ncbi:MAG: hypothetical protein GX754_06310, partial [Clostridiaceae bacterium]|nr:hypothetical protein [Clostridiaceae bacterium]
DHVFGYISPANIPLQAHIEGFMYFLTGEKEYAIEVRKCLLEVERLKEIYPREKIRQHPEYRKGLPAVDPAFFLQPYIYGYLYIKDSGVLDDTEKLQVENSIRSSVNVAFSFPEWGAHNRSMLRAWSLSLAARTLGENKCTGETEEGKWQKLANYLAEESWGRWSIEDAELYIPLWLISTINYAILANKEREYFSMPQTKYYFDYITHLITSNGQIPDFGDAHFNSNWYIWLACLEKGASMYNCGYMKYAAKKIWEFGTSVSLDTSKDDGGSSNTGTNAKSNENIVYSPHVASYLVYAYHAADDRVVPEKPGWKSEEVLEELVGKKIAFRNGWEESSTYLLLNYRDEGYYACIPRRYLRTTLSVRAEKMHHGHSDENSIVFLARDGSILLNDAGYRENLPNGKYRADIYHNRLVFREGLKGEGTTLYNFLHDEGYYKKTVTEKIHFQDFGRLAISRTRLYNTLPSLTWDRIITYLEEEDTFIIVDWVCPNSKAGLTIANLWHTGEILAQKNNARDGDEKGEGEAFDTRIPWIYKAPGDKNPRKNNDNTFLCIEFPCNGGGKKVEVNNIKRHYGDGVMISQYSSKEYAEKEAECFVTVLTPHDAKEGLEGMDKITGRVTVDWISEKKDAILLEYRGNSTLYLAYKLDLEKGIMADEDEYPRYTWEMGRISYGNHGKVAADADFSYVEIAGGKIKYGFINGSGIEYNGRVLYRTPDFTTCKFGTNITVPSNHKWRAWKGERTESENN